MKIAMITGASRGIGEAVARKLLSTHDKLITISRNASDTLKRSAVESGVAYSFLPANLSLPEQIESVATRTFEKLEKVDVEEVLLVNNAGTVEPVGPIEKCNHSDIMAAVHVNLIAPMILTSVFLEKTAAWNAKKTVVNISSGAGKNPYFGWSVYCATKAGIDMFTRAVAEEQRHNTYPAIIVSFAPGIVDTSMQTFIRNTDKSQFMHRDKFVHYKESGKVADPSDVADVLVEEVVFGSPENGAILDFRDFIK